MDIFERIEMFFRRLEVYTEVPPSAEMMDIIIWIMVEVLLILGIATKEIRQGRLSEQFIRSMSTLTEGCSEKLGKKLIGRTDMEDALQGLDQSRSDDPWTKSHDTTVNVLYAFSATVGAGDGLVSPRSCGYLGSAPSYLLGRHSPPPM